MGGFGVYGRMWDSWNRVEGAGYMGFVCRIVAYPLMHAENQPEHVQDHAAGAGVSGR